MKILKQRHNVDDSERDKRQLSLIRSMITANETQKRLGQISEEEYEKANVRIEAMLEDMERRYYE